MKTPAGRESASRCLPRLTTPDAEMQMLLWRRGEQLTQPRADCHARWPAGQCSDAGSDGLLTAGRGRSGRAALTARMRAGRRCRG